MDRCKVIAPRRFEDERGFFYETWNKKSLLAEGIDSEFVQDNLSMSREIGTVRGLHCSDRPTRRPSLFAAHAVGCLMWLLMFAKAAPISDAGLPKSSALRMADNFSFLQGFCMDL